MRASSPNCVSGSSGCTLQNDVAVYGSSIYDLIGKFFSKLNPKNWFNFNKNKSETSNKDVANAMNAAIAKGNSVASGNAKAPCDGDKYVTNAFNSPPRDANNQCGIQQALNAYQENQSKLDENIIVYNDFSDGAQTGKMWFLNPDGSTARIIRQNPISVSRGVGGFGAGDGSKKTPNGAIMTRTFNPPRAGNINDGITKKALCK